MNKADKLVAGSIADRIQTTQAAAFARPVQLLNLLIACTGRTAKPFSLGYPGLVTHLCRTWLRFRQNDDVLRYLLLLSDGTNADDTAITESDVNHIASSARPHPGDQHVLELFQSKIDAFGQLWRSLCADKSHRITAEVVQILSSLCVSASIFLEIVPASFHRSRDLQTSVDKLWTELCGFLAKQEIGLLHGCIDVMSPLILSLRPPLDRKNAFYRAIHKMSKPLYVVLKETRQRERMETPFTNDAMDIDDPFPRRENQSDGVESVNLLNRLDDNCLLFEDSDSARIAVTIQCGFLAEFNLDNEAPIADKLIDYIMTLGKEDILIGWHFIADFVTEDPQITRTSACNLLEFLAEFTLTSYEFERCEASTSACISLVGCFVPLWTSNENDDLTSCAFDLYDWFIDVLLGEGLGSPKTMIRLAGLLERILDSNPSFSTGSSRPSARTSLFKVLCDGDLVVKFYVSQMIPSIFGRFVLKEHDMIFGDVLENLPRDPDWTEGIALRLYFLSQLASKWHTLLRRSIYHIVEAPGQVPLSSPYAQACLRKVANALGLTDSKDVFKLFSSQILYTWMETQSLSAIPFDIFGYSTLRGFLLDVQDEAVAQIIMRVKEEDMNDISRILETPVEELLALSFPRSEAYSIARDISTPPSQEPGFKGAETTMRNLLGTERFMELFSQSFPEIIAAQFRCADQTEQMGKAFAKRPAFQDAQRIWSEIEGKSSSKAILPASQQPSFRAKFLLDELEFICKRMGLDLQTIWTPTLFCFVTRTLLESIHPALGSLHACSVLRKLKVLLSVAGPVALRDYPFEMLLHSLRPYITDFQCSEDALGLFWYLIDNGREYLLANPSFVAGLAVSTLASLKAFLASPQDSTTQESHFRATLSQVHIFHRWFSAFLEEYAPSNLSDASRESLRKVIRSSQYIQLVGNATKDTYESDLMSELLRDQVSGQNLLSKPATDLVFSLLCSQFERPIDFRDDILGDDQVAANNTVALLNSLENQSHSTDFRLWAARALGRAYASTGVISDSLLREQRLDFVDSSPVSSHLTSKFSILHIICHLLLSNSCQNAGLAERTLQVIVQNISANPDLGDCLLAIPDSLMQALLWAPYQCPELCLRSLTALNHRICWKKGTTVTEWAKDFALALCDEASNDPVIGSLVVILHSMPSLATQLLPYILHDVLLSEYDGNQMTRHAVSEAFREAFQDANEHRLQHIRLIIYCILYLRYQQMPRETTMDERDGWLDIDYILASSAAAKCRMYKTALLFVEIHSSRISTSSRRSSMSMSPPSPDLLHEIFTSIDDPDLFYGIQHDASLDSIVAKLQHEGCGFKNLFFQSAKYDADIKLTTAADDIDTSNIIEALNSTNLHGMASVISRAPGPSSGKASAFDGVISSALYLQQWDIPVPSTASATGNLFRALQSLNTAEDRAQMVLTLDDCFLGVLDRLSDDNQSLSSLRTSMRTLGILTEVDEALMSQSPEQLKEAWNRILQRSSWLKYERYSVLALVMAFIRLIAPSIRFDNISQMLSSHEALFSLIKQKPNLKTMLNLSTRDAQLLEVEAIRESLRINRDHNVHQGSLKSAMLLSKLVDPCASLGISIDAAAAYDLANVLWDQGEMTTSIRMLQQLIDQSDLRKQSIPVNPAKVLASLVSCKEFICPYSC